MNIPLNACSLCPFWICPLCPFLVRFNFKDIAFIVSTNRVSTCLSYFSARKSPKHQKKLSSGEPPSIQIPADGEDTQWVTSGLQNFLLRNQSPGKGWISDIHEVLFFKIDLFSHRIISTIRFTSRILFTGGG